MIIELYVLKNEDLIHQKMKKYSLQSYDPYAYYFLLLIFIY